MKKNSVKSMSVALLICVFGVLCGMCVFVAVHSFAQTGRFAPVGEWNADTWEESYTYGSTFDVPTMTVNVGDKEIAAEHILVKPNGSAVSSDTVVLDEVGLYRINYSAYSGGKAYTTVKNFYVDYPSLEYGDGTKVEWGVHPLTDPNDPETASSGISSDKGRGTEGLLVRLAKGDVLTFNKLIDISDLEKDDLLINGFITPDIRGAADFTNITFTLTDSADPSVFMKINFNAYADGGSSYVRAAGNGQPYTGVNQYGNKPVHQGNQYGTSSCVSFTALRITNWRGTFAQGADARDAMFSLKYDKSAVALSHVGEAQNEYVIVDFDNPSYFSKLWSGFKSDKVRLSITADNYVSDTANFCISEIFGFTSAELQGMIGSEFRDEEAPEITLSYDETALPDAVMGMTYPVLPATAFDYYGGARDVTVRVWHNYGSENATRVNISNGRFRTETPGIYAIEYVATDCFGNEGTKAVVINCVQSAVEMSFETPAVESVMHVGERIELPVLSSEDISGGIGDKTVETFVKFNGTENSIVRWFNPQEIGEYTIVYRVTDYVGASAEREITVTVKPNDRPVILKNPEILRYYIEGSSYPVPVAVAKDYNTNTELNCSVRITDGNGSKVYVAGETFSLKCGDETADVRFEFIDKEGNVLLSETVPAVSVWEKTTSIVQGIPIEIESLKTEKFFDATETNFALTVGEMLATASAARSGWTFITPQLADRFDIELRKFDFNVGDSVKLTLTDVGNSEIRTGFSLTKTERGTRFEAADGNGVDIPLRMEGNNSFKVSYLNGEFTLSGISVTDDLFGGFESEYMYVSLECIASAGATYSVVGMNSVAFTNASKDRIAPSIYLSGDYGGSYSIGDVYVLCPAKCADVFFPDIEYFVLSVFGPSDKPVYTAEGVLLQNVDPTAAWEFTLDSYGSYRVQYEAKDGSGNVSSINYVVSVTDRVPPEVVFEKAPAETAKVGDCFALPAFAVSDNLTSAEEVIVIRYVINPNGKRIYLGKDGSGKEYDSFVFMYSGTYEFHIMAVDASGNMAEQVFCVTVAE